MNIDLILHVWGPLLGAGIILWRYLDHKFERIDTSLMGIYREIGELKGAAHTHQVSPE